MSQGLLFLLTIFGVLIGGVVMAWWLDRRLTAGLKRYKEDGALTEWLKVMQGTLNETNRNITETLQRQFQSQQTQLKSTAVEFAKMQKEMGKFTEIGRTISKIQEFLQSPKLRGNIGEEVLNEILRQMLPTQSFHLQYSFKSGVRVDACIDTEAGKLPVDAKFPLSSWRQMNEARSDPEREAAKKQFTKDVKHHLDTIAEKYILPDEGTMDMALMYIPSESIFYEITHLNEVLDHARKKRVIPVSPTTLYAYLQVILASFQQQQFMSRSKEILAMLRSLSNEYAKTERGFQILGKHMQNASNVFMTVSQSLTLLGQKLASAQSLKSGEESEAEQLEG